MLAALSSSSSLARCGRMSTPSPLSTVFSLWLVVAATVTAVETLSALPIRGADPKGLRTGLEETMTPAKRTPREDFLWSKQRRMDREDDDKYSSCDVIDEDLLEDLVGGESEFLKTLTDSNTLVALEVSEFNVSNTLTGRTGSLQLQTLGSRMREYTLNGLTTIFPDVSNLIPTLSLGDESSILREYVQRAADTNFQAIPVQGTVQRNGDDQEYRALIVGIPNVLRLFIYVDSLASEDLLETDFDESDGRWAELRFDRQEKRRDRDDVQKAKFGTIKNLRREDSKKSSRADNFNSSFSAVDTNDSTRVVVSSSSSNSNNNDEDSNGDSVRPSNRSQPPRRRLQDDTIDYDGESLDLFLDCENLDQVCVRRIEWEFQEEMQKIAAAVLQEKADVAQQVTDLDRWKFELVAVVGVACFALHENDLTARQVFDCLQEFVPSIQERYTLRYRPILNHRYEIELQRLRNIDLLVNRKQTEAFYICCPGNRDDEDDDEDDAERRVLAAGALQSPATPTAQQVFFTASLQGAEQRRLQEDDFCLVDDFNDDREGELLDISDSLYDSWVAAQGRGRHRRLGQPSRKLPIQFGGSTAPSDAFSIRDFDKNVQHSQQVTHKNDGYALDVTQVADVVVDLQAIVDDKSNLPKKVRKYIRKYDMDATAVDAIIPSTSGDIPFVGIIMTSIDTAKQLLWPADFGNYDTNVPQEELTRGRRTLRSMFGPDASHQQNLAQTTSQQRRLQDEVFSEAAANGLCNPNGNAVHASCGNSARSAFRREVSVIAREETTRLLELDKEETELYQHLLETHISAAFDCGAAEDGEVAELALATPEEYDEPTSFDPDATFDCARFTRSSFVVADYVTQLSELQNRRRFVQERTKSFVREANLKWVGRYKRCCLEDTLLGRTTTGSSVVVKRAKLEKQKAKWERQLAKAVDDGNTKRANKLRKKLAKVEEQLGGR